MAKKTNPKISLVMSVFIAAMLPIPVFSDMPMAMPTEEPPLIQFTNAHLTNLISEIEYYGVALVGAKIYLGFENMGGSGTVTILFNTIFGPDRSETYEIENAGRYDLFIHVGLRYSAFHNEELRVSSPNQIGNSKVYTFEEAQIISIKEILLIPILPPPEVYYVDHRANGSGNGLNWENALQHVQTALQLAKFYEGSVHEIRVAQGTYQPDTVWSFGRLRSATFQLIDDIEVKGGYAGVGSPDPNARDVNLFETILSGDRAGNDVDVNDPCDLLNEPTRAENSYHVVTGSGTDASAVLDGFIITAGNANWSLYANNYGGGMITHSNSSPTLIDCTFSGNSAEYGAGMFNYPSSPAVTNCTFSSNWADYGGGMYNSVNSSPTLTNCTFSGNSAEWGGGMRNHSASPTVSDCIFSDNSADNYGGGMLNDANGSVTLTNCTFTGNSAGDGGGMFNLSSSPTLTSCTFSGNLATVDGGGMRNKGSSPSLTDCTFTANSATYGGAIADSNSSSSLTDCTFTTNSATYGGGMKNYSSSPTVTDCIFSGNSADDFGGGMFNQANADPTLTNCTFSSNWAKYGGGGMANDSNTDPTVIDCTFSDNLAGQGGGGMANYSYSSPTVTDCIFSGNSADNYGGGMFNAANSSPILTDCTFSSNSADEWGGGMSNEANSSPTVTGCIFSSNSADYGGGVLNFSSSPMLTNCTFTANSADSYGGGIFEFDNNPTVIGCAFSGNVAGIDGGGTAIEDSTATLVNCTFSGNAAVNGNALACDSEPQTPSNVELANCILWDGGSEIWNNDGSTITITYSDIQSGYVGTGNLNSDPCFVQLGCWVDANDPNIIVEPNDPNAVWVDGNYRLRPDSPCIDAGDNTAVPSGVTTDLDGHPRFIDDLCTTDTGNPPGADAIVDMGAYEFLRSDIDSNGAVDMVDFSRFALYWKESGCGACGGADLTCDGDVDLYDLKEFGDNWLAGVSN